MILECVLKPKATVLYTVHLSLGV